jgi:hypothetical protein
MPYRFYGVSIWQPTWRILRRPSSSDLSSAWLYSMGGLGYAHGFTKAGRSRLGTV